MTQPILPSNNKLPIIMGILNVTPDSFSDGGRFFDVDDAVRQGQSLLEQGADVIDIGGESTRPGSKSVDEAEEKRRVVPVIEKLFEQTKALISVDTIKPGVAQAALEAGAAIVNDVSNLRGGEALAEVVAEADATLVLMHSRGTPEDMQQRTMYADVVAEVVDELLLSVEKVQKVGVGKDRIWLDPGIGFAKTVEQNIELLRRIDEIVAIGYPVLVGPSRKSFIGKITGADVSERLGGTIAASIIALLKGAQGVRVHDVAEVRQAAWIAEAITKNNTMTQRLGEVVHA